MSDSVSDSFSVLKQDKAVFSRTDNLAARVKKLQAIKETTTQDKVRRIHIKEVKAMVEEPTNHDVQFLIKVNKCRDVSDPTYNLFWFFVLLCSAVCLFNFIVLPRR